MTTYLGYRDGDADTAWGRFYDPEMAPLSPHVVEALSRGPQPEPLLTDRADVSAFIRTASEPTEDGYAGIQQLAHDANLLFYGQAEAREGREAFKEKRTPDFSQFPRRA